MYKSKNELPEGVKSSLPPRAQEIYRKTFNSAWQTYKDSEKRKGGLGQEETAHKVAWSAVKREYSKTPQGWQRKGGI